MKQKCRRLGAAPEVLYQYRKEIPRWDQFCRGKETIYLHRSGALLENGLDRPKNRYGRYGFPGFYSISISSAGVDEAGVFL